MNATRFLGAKSRDTGEQNEDDVRVVVLSKPTTSFIPTLQRLRENSIYLGLLIGCFVQWSSIGANFKLTILHGASAPLRRSGTLDPVTLFWLWSLFSSTLGVLILVCLRQMVSMLIGILEGWIAAPFRSRRAFEKEDGEWYNTCNERSHSAQVRTANPMHSCPLGWHEETLQRTPPLHLGPRHVRQK
jgi:hypothetical protein